MASRSSSEQEVGRGPAAAGMLIEFDTDRSTPIIVDRKLYRQLCRDALKAHGLRAPTARITQREADRRAEREARKHTPA